MPDRKASAKLAAAKSRSRAFELMSPAGRVWYQSTMFWRTAVIVFIVGTTSMLGSWGGWQFFEGKRQNDLTARQLLLDTVTHDNTLHRWFEAASQILRIAAQNKSIRDFDQQPDAAIEQLRVIAKEAGRFSQLRILANDGTEQLRLDSKFNNLEVAPDESLQDKSERYYFTATTKLSSGGVYISPIDLNVERGEIETPWRPTARLGTPITAVDGRRQGYLVFNLDMGVPLSEFGLDDNQVTRTELLNADGYWLAGITEDRLWGFMTGTSVNMARDQNELWQTIVGSTAQGPTTFVHNHRLYHVNPLTRFELSGLGDRESAQDGGDRLYILASAPQYNRIVSPHLSDIVTLSVGGGVIAILSLIIGMFNLHRQQSHLAQQRIAAQLVSERRMASLGRIVAGVAHEMRTPIGNAVTVISTLGAHLDDLSAKLGHKEIDRQAVVDDVGYLQKGVKIVQKNLDRTVTLVGHFHQTATNQSNHNRRRFDLGSLLDDLVQTMRQQYAKAGITIRFEGRQTAPVENYSDAIDQVVLSLVSNAKSHAFTNRTDAQITVRLIELDEQFYQIEVEDNGVGIDPALHERVFEPFWTANSTSPGSGLGMAVVGNVVETVIGGNVYMRSVVDEGTTFSLLIPKLAPKGASGQKSGFSI